jgi:hypothetical protein
MTSHFRFGSAIAVSALVLSVGAASAQFNLRQAPGPQPGQCQPAPVVAMGQNMAQAQQLWIAQATQIHGPNWANWTAAANKSVHPNGGSGWMASARPCYYLPVR